MKKAISVLICGLMTLGLLSGCSGGKETGSQGTQKSDNEVQLKVWHDGNEDVMKTIESYVNDKLTTEKVSIMFEKKAGLTDQIKLYGNDEKNGPDLYFYAHDSLGMFADMGVLAPVTDAVSADKLNDLIPTTVDAGKYKDTQYLLPLYYETLLFIYNKDLWKGEIPNTTDEIYKYMEANTDTKKGTYALVNQHSTAYNVAPVINGFGGYLLDKDGKVGLTDEKTKEAITYNQKFAKLQADGTDSTATTLFKEGKAQAIIGGPWLVPGIKETKINMGLKALSEIKLPNGSPLAPYAGVQGMGVLKHAMDSKKEAVSKVLETLLNPELGVKLATVSSCAPANQKSYENNEVKKDEMILIMKKTMDTAQPMPNISAMSVLWQPTESMLAEVNKSGADINATADKYQQQAEAAIKDMQ